MTPPWAGKMTVRPGGALEEDPPSQALEGGDPSVPPVHHAQRHLSLCDQVLDLSPYPYATRF